MGQRGPAPKRSDQRRRTNTPAAGEPTKAPAAGRVQVPPAQAGWHMLARRWYESLAESGQHAFYEASDWAAAAVIAESISRELNPQPLVVDGEVRMMTLAPKAASIAAWLKGMTALLATEGDRRRAALELQRPKPAGEGEPADVPHLDDARRRLRGAG